jgi:hypothetical protein
MRSIVLVSVFALSGLACRQTTAPQAQLASSPSAAVAPTAKLAKIAFIDKEHACDCTRKRVDGTWAALEAALGTPAKFPVERIHVDTESAKAGAYTALKPLMVPPGIYFVDQRNGLLEMLEGEVTVEQIAAVLKTR